MRLVTYHLKAHTTINKLVSKVSAQKKGKKSYDSYECVQISVVSGLVLPDLFVPKEAIIDTSLVTVMVIGIILD